MQKIISLLLFTFLAFGATAQEIRGKILNSNEEPIPFAAVQFQENNSGTLCDENGEFSIETNLNSGSLKISAVGYKDQIIELDGQTFISVIMESANTAFEEVVVTGTLNPVSRMESPVPVEIYTPKFFQRNPTPNVFEALQNVNGVRPQVNCNVCNTGDIHINGLEGPYTMVLLDGMPIVSGLSTVYGLSGIPNSMIERIEIVKGPASSLYGSEAVGGLINIITKSAAKAPKFTADVMATSWTEKNIDLGFKKSFSNGFDALTGVNYYHYGKPIDNNGDNFTDLTLQNRVSVFQKLQLTKNRKTVFNVAGRYFYEDRWGGEMNWTPTFRGGDQVYGESIYTQRWEVLGKYQLPTHEDVSLSVSYNDHEQNSVYGDTPYLARQKIAFGQLLWLKGINKHQFSTGLAVRNTFYNDNTPATASSENLDIDQPNNTFLPGVFVQDEIKVTDKFNVLGGYRLDYHPTHKLIHTPRLALKYSPTPQQVVRFNVGTGFRVVNVFTEDHAALTGARDVIINEELLPERSTNLNLNYMGKLVTSSNSYIGLDATAFYTYFYNRITPDYETNTDQIIYRNLDGHSVSKGISANIDFNAANGFSASIGGTLMDNRIVENGVSRVPLLTERFQGVWSFATPVFSPNLTFSYTGNLYSPMDLPVLGELDPRPSSSPWWSIQNIQLSYKHAKSGFEIYGGIKNLLDFTPAANSIARAHDPFDRMVDFDAEGNVLPTAENPYALTFDPSYVYAPNQGRRGFIGLRWNLD
ncbi:TonB-dependent receptor [Jiulongibacter sp. NS-SX5]|uniref:TonB-dependent receptor n=1 Tax=Jiulongibacter sp. NS-SX5 TaxID=3463854 RepID=UPI0040589848